MRDLVFYIDGMARWILLFLLLVNVVLVIKPILMNYTINYPIFPKLLSYTANFNLIMALFLFLWGPSGMLTLLNKGMGMKEISLLSSTSDLLISQMGMILISLLLIILYRNICKKEMPNKEKYMMMSYLYITVFSIVMATHPLPIKGATKDGRNTSFAYSNHEKH